MIMQLFYLYLIESLILIVPATAYILISKVFKSKIKNYDKVVNIFSKVVAISAVSFVLITYFHNNNAMVAVAASQEGQIKEGVGNVFLVGVPYGNHRFANFLAWFGTAIAYPFATVVLLNVIFPFKYGKVINRYLAFPMAIIEFITLFNLCYALNGNVNLDFRNIMVAVTNGLILLGTLMVTLQTKKEDFKGLTYKDYLYCLGLVLIAFIYCLPSHTFSTLFNTDTRLLGIYQKTLRIYDLSFAHRVTLYLCVGCAMFIYFYLRNSEENCRKTMLLTIAIGSLLIFFTDYGSNDIFLYRSNGSMLVAVTRIPIHLCHTALFIVPICLAFDLKRLFYFTYFINVFGAICAMLMPNNGETQNVFLNDVILFWYNHFSAFSMPLLCVALGMFPKAKFKQMLWSLFYFGIYFILIVFANAWLSNYVSGYNPDVIGSGTDFLFINDDFIVSKIMGDRASEEFLSHVLKWKWGNLTFVIRPLYQSIFFLVYVGVAFVMWYIYALFFKIADSHNDLHNQLVIGRKEHIDMKKRKEMRKLNNEEIQNKEASLVFENFFKKYGKSASFSAEDINLEVKGGEIFGFLGPNGAGKSTCIKCAIGVQPITNGHIFICGYDVSTESVRAKKEMGYVPDHYALYERLTGREYINYIADLYDVCQEDRDQRIEKYVNLFELNQAFDNRMQTYSHGMKQKITIIAALVHNPKVWILDEPLTGLDTQSIYQVKQCMLQHAEEGNIVFFSSHIIDVVEKMCTRIAIINKGKIVYQNTMEGVLKEHPEGLEQFYINTLKENEELDEE